MVRNDLGVPGTMDTAIFDCVIRLCDFFLFVYSNLFWSKRHSRHHYVTGTLQYHGYVLFSIICVVKEILLYYWLDPQQDRCQVVGGMRHVGFRVLLVLSHCLCYKNDVILYDLSDS